MSSSADVFPGAVVLNATLKANPGKGDELAKLLAKIRDHALTDQEPGCSIYLIARSGDNFAVWEKYSGQEAIKAHLDSPAFHALVDASREVLEQPTALRYYEEF